MATPTLCSGVSPDGLSGPYGLSEIRNMQGINILPAVLSPRVWLQNSGSDGQCTKIGTLPQYKVKAILEKKLFERINRGGMKFKRTNYKVPWESFRVTTILFYMRMAS